MNREYILGLISAKISLRLKDADYEVIKKLTYEEQIKYINHISYIKTPFLTYEELEKETLEELKEEIASYIKTDHVIYRYFFYDKVSYKENISDLEKLSDYKKNKSLAEYVKILHMIKNIEVLFRMKRMNKDIKTVQSNLLNTIEDVSIYLDAYTSIEKIIELTKRLTLVEIKKEDDILLIEQKLDDYLSNKFDAYAYSDILDKNIIYYIISKKKELNNLLKIHYFGGVL